MVRRGQSLTAETEAKKNSGSSLTSSVMKALGVLVVALAFVLVVPFDTFGAETTEPTPQTTTAQTTNTYPSAEYRAQARSWYRMAVKYRAKAHAYGHKIPPHAHASGTHGRLPYTGKLGYEKTRALVWKKRAEAGYRKYRAYITSTRPCVAAGFPRWYCPILMKATHRKGVPHWSRDANLAFIISHESGFNPRADNPTSTAYGLFQMLTERSSDPYTQTLNGVRYIQGRYGSPANAVAFWQSHRWY